MSCQCKSENLFVAPHSASGNNGQRKLKLFKKIKLRMGLGKYSDLRKWKMASGFSTQIECDSFGKLDYD